MATPLPVRLTFHLPDGWGTVDPDRAGEPGAAFVARHPASRDGAFTATITLTGELRPDTEPLAEYADAAAARYRQHYPTFRIRDRQEECGSSVFPGLVQTMEALVDIDGTERRLIQTEVYLSALYPDEPRRHALVRLTLTSTPDQLATVAPDFQRLVATLEQAADHRLLPVLDTDRITGTMSDLAGAFQGVEGSDWVESGWEAVAAGPDGGADGAGAGAGGTGGRLIHLAPSPASTPASTDPGADFQFRVWLPEGWLGASPDGFGEPDLGAPALFVAVHPVSREDGFNANVMIIPEPRRMGPLAELADGTLERIRRSGPAVQLMRRQEVGTPAAPGLAQVLRMLLETDGAERRIIQAQAFLSCVDKDTDMLRAVLRFVLNATPRQLATVLEDFQACLRSFRLPGQ